MSERMGGRRLLRRASNHVNSFFSRFGLADPLKIDAPAAEKESSGFFAVLRRLAGFESRRDERFAHLFGREGWSPFTRLGGEKRRLMPASAFGAFGAGDLLLIRPETQIPAEPEQDLVERRVQRTPTRKPRLVSRPRRVVTSRAVSSALGSPNRAKSARLPVMDAPRELRRAMARRATETTTGQKPRASRQSAELTPALLQSLRRIERTLVEPERVQKVRQLRAELSGAEPRLWSGRIRETLRELAIEDDDGLVAEVERALPDAYVSPVTMAMSRAGDSPERGLKPVTRRSPLVRAASSSGKVARARLPRKVRTGTPVRARAARAPGAVPSRRASTRAARAPSESEGSTDGPEGQEPETRTFSRQAEAPASALAALRAEPGGFSGSRWMDEVAAPEPKRARISADPAARETAPKSGAPLLGRIGRREERTESVGLRSAFYGRFGVPTSPSTSAVAAAPSAQPPRLERLARSRVRRDAREQAFEAAHGTPRMEAALRLWPGERAGRRASIPTLAPSDLLLPQAAAEAGEEKAQETRPVSRVRALAPVIGRARPVPAGRAATPRHAEVSRQISAVEAGSRRADPGRSISRGATSLAEASTLSAPAQVARAQAASAEIADSQAALAEIAQLRTPSVESARPRGAHAERAQAEPARAAAPGRAPAATSRELAQGQISSEIPAVAQTSRPAGSRTLRPVDELAESAPSRRAPAARPSPMARAGQRLVILPQAAQLPAFRALEEAALGATSPAAVARVIQALEAVSSSDMDLPARSTAVRRALRGLGPVGRVVAAEVEAALPAQVARPQAVAESRIPSADAPKSLGLRPILQRSPALVELQPAPVAASDAAPEGVPASRPRASIATRSAARVATRGPRLSASPVASSSAPAARRTISASPVSDVRRRTPSLTTRAQESQPRLPLTRTVTPVAAIPAAQADLEVATPARRPSAQAMARALAPAEIADAQSDNATPPRATRLSAAVQADSGRFGSSRAPLATVTADADALPSAAHAGARLDLAEPTRSVMPRVSPQATAALRRSATRALGGFTPDLSVIRAEQPATPTEPAATPRVRAGERVERAPRVRTGERVEDAPRSARVPSASAIPASQAASPRPGVYAPIRVLEVAYGASRSVEAEAPRVGSVVRAAARGEAGSGGSLVPTVTPRLDRAIRVGSRRATVLGGELVLPSAPPAEAETQAATPRLADRARPAAVAADRAALGQARGSVLPSVARRSRRPSPVEQAFSAVQPTVGVEAATEAAPVGRPAAMLRASTRGEASEASLLPLPAPRQERALRGRSRRSAVVGAEAVLPAPPIAASPAAEAEISSRPRAAVRAASRSALAQAPGSVLPAVTPRGARRAVSTLSTYSSREAPDRAVAPRAYAGVPEPQVAPETTRIRLSRRVRPLVGASSRAEVAPTVGYTASRTPAAPAARLGGGRRGALSYFSAPDAIFARSQPASDEAELAPARGSALQRVSARSASVAAAPAGPALSRLRQPASATVGVVRLLSEARAVNEVLSALSRGPAARRARVARVSASARQLLDDVLASAGTGADTRGFRSALTEVHGLLSELLPSESAPRPERVVGRSRRSRLGAPEARLAERATTATTEVEAATPRTPRTRTRLAQIRGLVASAPGAAEAGGTGTASASRRSRRSRLETRQRTARVATSENLLVARAEGGSPISGSRRGDLGDTLGGVGTGELDPNMPGWAQRSIGETRVRGTVGGLMDALARARNPAEVVRAMAQREGAVRSARTLPAPILRLIDEIRAEAATEAESRAAEMAAQYGLPAPVASRRRGGPRSASSSKVFHSFTNLGHTERTVGQDGLGADRLMKLVRKLQQLVFLADSQRDSAMRQVRLAEDSASARAEGQAAPTQSGDSKSHQVDIEALSQEVLQHVQRELETRSERRQDDPDNRSPWF